MSQVAIEAHTYRATFILDTREQIDDMDALIVRIKENLAAVGCNITTFENLGTKEFARVTDRHRPSGVYLKFIFRAPSDAPAAIQEKFRLERAIYRIMVQSIQLPNK